MNSPGVLVIGEETTAASAARAEMATPPAADNVTPAPAPRVVYVPKTGDVITDGFGTNYVLTLHENGRGTLRLQIPKIRGKAARKALKRQRQALDRTLAHLAKQNERPAIDW